MKKKRTLLFLALLCSFLWGGCKSRQPFDGAEKNVPSEQRQLFAMDTFMTLQIYGENAGTAADMAVEEIRRLEGQLSAQDGEVLRINEAHGGSVSEDVTVLLQKSMQLYEETEGAFDVTVYPVVKAWGFIDKNYRVPEEKELERLLVFVDASAVVFDAENRSVALPRQAELDFGGIAKGYTADRLLSVLRENGIASAMLNLGGNVALLGGKPDGSDFRIAVSHPEEKESYLGIVSARDTSIVTSGGYERFFEQDGKKYHHILDPTTGVPAENGLASVTIVCADGARADGLSTALFVLGTERAVSFWREHKTEFDCIFYTSEGVILITEGLKDRFSSAYEYQVVK